MPATLFVNINGVKGDAIETHHKGWIVVNSIDFGLERHSADEEGGVISRGFGKAVFNDVNFESELGQHSNGLMYRVASGVRLPKVEIHQTKGSGNQNVALREYVIWTLEDAVVNKYEINSSSEEIPKENWSIRAAKIEILYKFPTDPTKEALDGKNNFKWDIGKGEMG